MRRPLRPAQEAHLARLVASALGVAFGCLGVVCLALDREVAGMFAFFLAMGSLRAAANARALTAELEALAARRN